MATATLGVSGCWLPKLSACEESEVAGARYPEPMLAWRRGMCASAWSRGRCGRRRMLVFMGTAERPLLVGPVLPVEQKPVIFF